MKRESINARRYTEPEREFRKDCAMKLLHTSVIERAGENGYEFYRIPGIVATPRGTLLTYYEARHGSDWAVIDLYARRSMDQGATWEERRMLFSGRNVNTTNNPVMIVDGQRLHLLCFENYKRLFHRVSDDEGLTWSEPVEISAALEEGRKAWPWTCAAVGPGHGTRLASGRIIATVWMASNPASIFAHGPSKVSTIYSDDHGETWHLGEVFAPEGTTSPNEACIAQLSDGRVLMNIRTARPANELYTTPHYRTLVVSADGSGGWTDYASEALPDPVCCGGMCECPGGLLFTNCDSFSCRAHHTLRRSADDGRTWPDSLEYEPLAGYSDCCYDPVSKSAFTAFEFEHETQLRVARIEL